MAYTVSMAKKSSKKTQQKSAPQKSAAKKSAPKKSAVTKSKKSPTKGAYKKPATQLKKQSGTAAKSTLSSAAQSKAVQKAVQTALEPLKTLVQEDSTASEIIRRVRDALSPINMSLKNLSHGHEGHDEAKKHGGGHYSLHVISEMFAGLNLQQRQKWVMGLVNDLFGKAIHALQLDLKAPSEVPLKEQLVAPLRREATQSSKKPRS